VLGHGLGEARAALDVLADFLQHALELAGLELALEDLQRAEQRQAGVLERGELASEGGQRLGIDAAEGEADLLLLLWLGGLALLGGVLLFLLADGGREEPLALDPLDRFLGGGGVDGALLGLAGGVEGLVLERGHGGGPPSWSG